MKNLSRFTRTFILWLIVIVVISVIYGLIVCTLVNDKGTFGDCFGALNAVFAGCAFAGIIVTILQQSEDLQATRDEMRVGNIESAKMTFETSMFSYLSRMDQYLPKEHDIKLNQIFELLREIKGLYRADSVEGDGLEKELWQPINSLRSLLSEYARWRRSFYSWCLRIDEEIELKATNPKAHTNWKKRLWHFLSSDECRMLFLQTAYMSDYHQQEWKEHDCLVRDEPRIANDFGYWKPETYNFVISCLALPHAGSDKKLSKQTIRKLLTRKELSHIKPQPSKKGA